MASSSLCHLHPPVFASRSDPLSQRPTAFKPAANGPLSSARCICPTNAQFGRGGEGRIVAEQKKRPPKVVEVDPTWVDDGSGQQPATQKEGGGLFGWVTNNKSSKGSIQLENTPAQVRRGITLKGVHSSRG